MKPCTVPCCSCNIYGIWVSKEGGGGFKAINSMASHKQGNQFIWRELTPLDTILLVQKYQVLSPNAFYGLEAYDTS